MYQYQEKDVGTCMRSRRVFFAGDSVTRQLFFQFAHIVDGTLPSEPPDDDHKHQDYTYTSKSDVQLKFIWDPFLNTSQTQTLLHPVPHPLTPPPALLVLGSGLWYLRYPDSGGLSAWEAQIEATFNAISAPRAPLADNVVVLPVEDVISSKLSRERAASMHASDIDAMNSDLAHRIQPHSRRDAFALLPPLLAHPPPGVPAALPLVFNTMLHPSQTQDGLHFSDAVVRMQAQVLLNARCNDVLPKAFPMDKTCCRAYPWPSVLHTLLLTVVILWGPTVWLMARRFSKFSSTFYMASSDTYTDPRASGLPWLRDEEIPALVVSFAAAIIYIADRTGYWLKEQKQFEPWTFAFLMFLSLSLGLVTVTRGDKDLGFLNREQTDEWKGWMQSKVVLSHSI